MRSMSKLNSSLIDRIAAGKIIHHPVNAVKELMENSLDADSKHIQITIMNGGLELIQIKDDGCGIQVDDMPLVCERHATSKLKDFKDLQKLDTFGFRGEALASISQIARVTIVSKAIDSLFGYQAAYKNGNILSKPKLCASNYGTMITIQDLFNNTPSRKKAIKSANNEFHRIVDCVRKYAIHNTNTGFSLKKDTSLEIADQVAKNPIERIRQIYGNAIASRLKSAEYKDRKWHFKIFYTDIKKKESIYKVDKKNSIFILFVNNRLVENNKIKNEVKQVYTNIKSNCKPPFVYLALNVNPNHLDVNIHPTKSEVRLLDEDQIVEKIAEVLGKALNECTAAATTSTKKQQKIAPAPLPKEATLKHYFNTVSSNERKQFMSSGSEVSSNSPDTPPPFSVFTRKEPLEDCFSKADHGITAEDPVQSLSGDHGGGIFIQAAGYQRAPSATVIAPFSDITNIIGTVVNKKKRAGVYLTKMDCQQKNLPSKSAASAHSRRDDMMDKQLEEEEDKEEENLQELESIITLKQEIRNAEDKAVSKMLARMHCIGCFDNVLSLANYKNSFYVINYNVISEEFFYQTVINQMGQFGKIFLSRPISICSCTSLNMPLAAPKEALKASLSILDHRELLNTYFQLDMVASDDHMDVYVTCLPMILNNYVPNLDRLPDFFENLTTEINWDNEIDCLSALAYEFASLYCCGSFSKWDQILNALNQGADFKAPRSLGRDNYIVQLEIPEDIKIN